MAIALFEADPAREAEVALWQVHIDRAVSVRPGFVGSRFSSTTSDPTRWAAAISFDREDRLRAWLDSPERRTLFDEAITSGLIVRTAPDIVLVESEHPPPGAVVVINRVRDEAEAAFVGAVHHLQVGASVFPGYVTAAVFGPGVVPGAWVSVLLFASDAQLEAWLASPERVDGLELVRPTLADDFHAIRTTTSFGSLIRVDAGEAAVTAHWRSALVVLLMLYPSVMFLSRFAAPRLLAAGVPDYLTVFIDNVITVALLTWALMPLATRAFRRWLDPVEGRSIRITIAGCLALAVGYAAAMLLYATVDPLHPFR